jgi:hypothetical protein
MFLSKKMGLELREIERMRKKKERNGGGEEGEGETSPRVGWASPRVGEEMRGEGASGPLLKLAIWPFFSKGFFTTSPPLDLCTIGFFVEMLKLV